MTLTGHGNITGYDPDHKELTGLRYDRGDVCRTVTEVSMAFNKESLTTMREGKQ